jgi:hypothetical protein
MAFKETIFDHRLAQAMNGLLWPFELSIQLGWGQWTPCFSQSLQHMDDS